MDRRGLSRDDAGMKFNRLLPTAALVLLVCSGASSAGDLGLKISLAHDSERERQTQAQLERWLYREVLRNPEKVGAIVKANKL